MDRVVDPMASEFFGKHVDDPENGICCDCGTKGASWASISHGIYLSIGAAGLHRSLGVKVSFVQSTTMDSWRPVHLRMMELGGNRRFHTFLREQGIPEDMPIRDKYSTRAAEWYRKNLKALAEESELPMPLPPGTGHLPASPTSPVSHVLDQVYAAAPPRGSMTSGGVPKNIPSNHQRSGSGSSSDGQSKKHQLDKGLDNTVAPSKTCPGEEPSELSLSSKTSSQRSALVDARSPTRSCIAPSFGLDGWWPLILPVLLGSAKCPTANRLQTMSSGKMEGFGSDCCYPNLLTNFERPEDAASDSCFAKALAEAGAADRRAAVAV